MSNAALDWAFETDARGSAKSVLIVLANHANENGECWPSQLRIAFHSGFSERTVRDALAELARSNFITINAVEGRNSVYRLAITPAAFAGDDGTGTPADFASPPAKPAAPPRQISPQPRQISPPNPKEPSVQPKGTRKQKPALFDEQDCSQGANKDDPQQAKRGRRLPLDWTPNADLVNFCRSYGLDPNAVLAHFRDYWVSQPGARGVKVDWDATFRNWCRNDKNAIPPTGGGLRLVASGNGKAPYAFTRMSGGFD